MLWHIALYSLKPGCPPRERAELIKRLHVLIDECPQIQSGRVFEQVGLVDGALATEFGVDTAQADIGVALEFTDEEQWRQYSAGSHRRELVAGFMAKLVQRRMSVQTPAPLTPAPSGQAS